MLDRQPCPSRRAPRRGGWRRITPRVASSISTPSGRNDSGQARRARRPPTMSGMAAWTCAKQRTAPVSPRLSPRRRPVEPLLVHLAASPCWPPPLRAALWGSDCLCCRPGCRTGGDPIIECRNGAAIESLTDTGGVEAEPDTECFADGRPASEVRVQVVTQRDVTIQAVVFSKDVTISAPAAALYERES